MLICSSLGRLSLHDPNSRTRLQGIRSRWRTLPVSSADRKRHPCIAELLSQPGPCSTSGRDRANGSRTLDVNTHSADQRQAVSEMPARRLDAVTMAIVSAAAVVLLSMVPSSAAFALGLTEPVQSLAASVSGPSIPGVLGDSQLREGLVSGFLLIFFSELGDKTFFIAVLLALKYRSQQALVFAGAFGALAVMTLISVGLGLVLHEADNVLASPGGLPIDDLVALALLLFFGVKTLLDAANADEKAKEEEEEAGETVSTFDVGAGLVISTFALVFAAEWGDKSFLATIALAAASSPQGVVIGAISGHGVATALAILGGNVLSKYISEKTVQYISGSLFLVFAAAQGYDLLRGV